MVSSKIVEKDLAFNFNIGNKVYISKYSLIKHLANEFNEDSSLPELITCNVLSQGYLSRKVTNGITALVRLKFTLDCSVHEVVVPQSEVLNWCLISCVNDYITLLDNNVCLVKKDKATTLLNFIAYLTSNLKPRFTKTVKFESCVVFDTDRLSTSKLPEEYIFYKCPTEDYTQLDILDVFGTVTPESYTISYLGTLRLVRKRLITGRMVIQTKEVSEISTKGYGYKVKDMHFAVRSTKLHIDLQELL